MAAKRSTTPKHSPPKSPPTARNVTARTPTARFWIVATAAGLLLRVLLLPIAPGFPWVDDHDDSVRWGIQATNYGLLTLYDHPPPRWNSRVWRDDRWVVHERDFDQLCNYPPLSVYLLYGSGVLFKAASQDRLINMVTARAVFSGWSIIADLLLAWGCAALVARYRPGWPARGPYLLVLLAPPLWGDSAIWGQWDSVLLAPAVWMVWALVTRRWTAAAVLYGLMVMLKPQAVLFIPVWGLAIVTARPFWRALVALPVAVGVVLVLAAPFMLHSGWSWWHESYVKNLLEAYPQTTLNAFNLWYMNLLICGSDDAMVRWLGIAKDAWGKALLVLGLGLGFLWMVRRWRSEPAGLLLWCPLALLACVMLPTRVHERYIVLVVPFLIVAAMLWRRFWPAVLMLLVVATAQLTWPSWLQAEAGQLAALERQAELYEQGRAAVPPGQRAEFPDLKERFEAGRHQIRQARAKTVGYEWLVTILALVATVATAAAAVSLKPRPTGDVTPATI